MITQQKITRIIIDHIEKIEVEEPKELLKEEFSQRSLTIRTQEGEKYELVFEADKLENLEFQTPVTDWLSPKLYTGRVDDE
jgi:hypothetical protein